MYFAIEGPIAKITKGSRWRGLEPKSRNFGSNPIEQPKIIYAMDQKLNPQHKLKCTEGPSYVVDRVPTRTVAPHGITGPEIERLNNAVHFMEGYGRLWWVTIKPQTEMESGDIRSIVADVQKRITRLQAKGELPQYSVTVFETRQGVHAHTIFIGNADITDRLRVSSFAGIINVAPVNDARGLTRKYLAKERTPQAGYRRQAMFGGRLKGSHTLPGGGDRVRLSKTLKNDAIRAGYVNPWQRTNARRSISRKRYCRRRCPDNV